MKRNVIFFPMDQLSHHLRCMELIDSISESYNCFIVSLKFDKFLSNLGYATIKGQCLDSEYIIKQSQIGHKYWMTYELLKPILDSQLEIMSAYNPIFIVNDYSFTANLAAKYLNIYSISLINGLFSRFLSIPRTIPNSEFASRISPLIHKDVHKYFEGQIFKKLQKPFIDLRKKLNLKVDKNNFLEEFEGDFNLILENPEFAPQNKLPLNFFHLGPLFSDKNRFSLNSMIELNPKKKSILVNMGTGGSFLKVECLNQDTFSDYNIVVVGDKNKILNAPHILSVEWLNLNKVLPNFDLVINQAGTGNIFQTLKFGKPMICFPTFFEQDWNAQRVEELGYGISINKPTNELKLKNDIEILLEKSKSELFGLKGKFISVEESKARFKFLIEILINSKEINSVKNSA